jgi:hypothetical protein
LKQIDTDKWGWLNNAIPIFILAGLTVIFFSDVLFQSKIFIHRDLSRFFYPLREFSAGEFLRLKIPLWNPYIHCGSPHLAELQTCVFYPLSAIYLLFSYPEAFNWFIITHVFLAGLFIYILMKEWGYSKYACFLSAAVFMFSGYIISVINLLASLASVIWLPLVILFYERALKKDWVKNSMITGIFMALMFLGGEPVILYATFFILILIEFRLRPIFLAILVFAGLSSFQILPFLEFLKYTSRNLMDFNEASMWSLPVYALLDLFIPYLSESDYMYKDYWTRQSWLLVYYMGIAVVMFAFIALKFDSTKRRRTIFYILALGLVLSFGRYTPLYYFLYNFLPGFSLSRYPIKFFFIAAFSLAVLAGMGMDYYARHARMDASFGKFLKSILAIAFAASFLYLVFNLNFYNVCDFLRSSILNIAGNLSSKKDSVGQLVLAGAYNIKRGIGLFMFLSVVMFLGIKTRAKLKAVLAFILLIAIVDIFTANKNVYQNMDAKEFLRPGGSIEFLQNDKGLFRIFDSPATLRQNMFVPERDYFEGMSGLKERVVSDRGVSFGIYDAYGYGSLYNRRHEEVMDIIIKSKMPDETNLLNLLNVKYVISPKDFKIDGYSVARKADKANIYENENCLARAFLADKAIIIKDEKKILEEMKSKEFEPGKEVILEEDFVVNPSALSPQFLTQVKILKYEAGEVVIKAETSAPRFLVLSDTYYPGWKVYVDARIDKIYRADYILRAVYLAPGRHIVKFIYDPFSFKAGLAITMITIGILLWLWIFRWR